MAQISIVVLAQQGDQFRACIGAIVKNTRRSYELIVVNDGDRADIREQLGRLKRPADAIVPVPAVEGVAAGFNRGAARASGEYIVLLRDSAVVGKDWLPPLVDVLRAHPRAALAGPLSAGVSGAQATGVMPSDSLAALSRASRAALTARGGPARRTTRLLSFAMLVRREAFRQLGGFDERFALESYEDDDLCFRALQAGYELYVAQESFVQYAPPPPLFPDDPDRLSRQMAANRQAGIDKWGADLTALLYDWKYPVTVSLCMIVKNEEATLGRCLGSVADLVDEIVIVDTGSTDRTKEIAAEFKAVIANFVWVNDFSQARNYAFSLATREYILWLDADDMLLPADRDRFLALKSAMPAATDAVSMHYNLGRDEHGNVTTSLRRNRLVRRSMGFKWIGIVHEYLEVYGNILTSDIGVTHDRMHTNSSRNLELYERKRAEGAAFGPRDMYYYANELFDHGQWERAAEQYERLLDCEHVWVEDRIGACGKAAECYHNLGRHEQARIKALQSFAYALPRAENCCRLGAFYLHERRYEEAVWWYRLASELEMPKDTSALLQHACWTWLPHLQLCVCYDRLGEYRLAYEENERAAEYIGSDSRIAANRAYLKGRLQPS